MKNLKTTVVATLILTLLFAINCKKEECIYDPPTGPIEPCTICEDSTFSKVGDGTSCEKTTEQAATLNGSQFTLSAGDNNIAYGSSGAYVYSVNSSQYPLNTTVSNLIDASSNVIPPDTILSGDWKSTSGATGRLNKVGVWGTGIPNQQWIGFSSCLDVPKKKKVCVGMAADNQCRFKINGVLIAELNNNFTINFNRWIIFEVELEAGTNIIEMEGYNNFNAASFGAEIYDVNLSQIQSFTTDAQIESSLLFSTKDQIGKLTQIGDFNGYSCPLGFAVDFCTGDSLPVCTMIQKGRVINCP